MPFIIDFNFIQYQINYVKFIMKKKKTSVYIFNELKLH